jgi:hypothetical protein
MTLEEKPSYNEAKLSTVNVLYEIGDISPGDLACIEEISDSTASMRLLRYHR